MTKEDIYKDLERREIVFGIKEDAIADMIDRRRLNEKILIAEGIPPKKEKTAGLNGLSDLICRVFRRRCLTAELTMSI